MCCETNLNIFQSNNLFLFNYFFFYQAGLDIDEATIDKAIDNYNEVYVKK